MDFDATSRSNYFRVKDPAKFRAWCEGLDLKLIEEVRHPQRRDGTYREVKTGRVGFLVETDHGDMPSYRFNGDGDGGHEVDWVEELAGHLKKGEVAIVMETGAEKMRYTAGVAWAVTRDGLVSTVDLDEIYQRAARKLKIDRKRIGACAY